jgi:hypothetical protein
MQAPKKFFHKFGAIKSNFGFPTRIKVAIGVPFSDQSFSAHDLRVRWVFNLDPTALALVVVSPALQLRNDALQILAAGKMQ